MPKKMGSGSRIRGGRPASRPRKVVKRTSRPSVSRRSTSPKRKATRTVKRQASRVRTNKVSSRPRPTVRPARVPVKRMPARPKPVKRKPAAPRAKAPTTKRMPSKPRSTPSRPLKRAPSSPRPKTPPKRLSEVPKRKTAATAVPTKGLRETPVRKAMSGSGRRAVRRQAVRPTSRGVKRGISNVGRVAAAGYAVNQLSRLNTSYAHPDILYQVNTLQSSLDELENRAGMSEVRADIANLDANLNHVLSLLESARDKEYMYQPDLEDIAYDALSRWQSVRGEVDTSIAEQTRLSASYLNPLNQNVSQLNAYLNNATRAASPLASLEGQINQAMISVRDAESTIEAVYDDIESQAQTLIHRLTEIHWALTQQAEASFPFTDGEDLFMAVKARWDQQGKDDPEGVLFLTNQRLLFERKEKIATKKVLFITTAKELVQEVMGAQPVKAIENVKAQSKGVFGHQDFLEVDFGKNIVPFHLDGQDSEDWAVYIQDARTGKMDENRATGSSLSFADLTGKLTQADILELQGEINELQDELMLKATQEELAELENKAAELTRELADLRARGYLVEKSLEADLEVLAMQWEKIKERSQATLKYQTKQLGQQMKEIESGMAKLAGLSGSLAQARPVYVNLKSQIASAEAQADAAEDTVLDQYDEYANELEMLDAHLEWVDWMLDAVSTASFKLLATESGVAAVEALWLRPGLDPENGVLFLTDQRFLWEDRVDDFELKFNLPLAEVHEVEEKEEEETGDESLLVTFGPKAPIANGEFVLSQPVAEEWLQMIGRAKAGDYATDRAVEIKESELERIRNAPSECPNCGAAFTAPILRGQTDVICEFCGVTTRI